MAARRPGLVAKKLMVRGKGGKTIRRTYWLRPNVGQAVRLSRMRKQGEENVAPEARPLYTPPVITNPRAGLKAFFAERGRPLSDDEVNKLYRIFQKPDGSLPTAEDFNLLFANPGKKTIPLMKESGRTTPWGQDEVVPDKDASGATKMASFDMQLNIDDLRIDDSGLRISMNVWGKPLFPPGHPREGQPTGESPIRMDKGFTRTYSKTGGELHIEHNYFVMQPRFQGGGLGSEIIKNQFSRYEQLGVNNVYVHGEWMGKWFWGRMGFVPTARNKSELTDSLRDIVESLQRGGSPVRQVDDSKNGYPRRTGPLLKPNGDKYSVDELMAIYNFDSKSANEVFAAKVEVKKDNGTEFVNLFKEMQLSNNGVSFYGNVKVRVGDPAYEAVREYYGMRPKIGTPEGAEFDRQEAERVRLRAEARPDVLAQANAILEPELREENARRAAAAEAARVERERQEAEAREAERVRQERQIIREPLLNPPGQPTRDALHRLINDRVDNTYWNAVQTITVANRAAWVAGGQTDAIRAGSQLAVDAIDGQLSARRVNAALELVERSLAIGDASAAASYRSAAQTHRQEGLQRAQQDEARGNAGAVARFQAAMEEGERQRQSMAAVRQETIANAGAAIARAEQERVARQAEEARVRQEDDARRERQRQAAQARAQELGTTPEQRPRSNSRAFAEQRDFQENMIRMTEDERAQYINRYPAAGAAFREVTGAAARARAEYAQREATIFAREGNREEATRARNRARRELAEANSQAAAFAAREQSARAAREQQGAVAARAQAALTLQSAEIDRLGRESNARENEYRALRRQNASEEEINRARTALQQSVDDYRAASARRDQLVRLQEGSLTSPQLRSRFPGSSPEDYTQAMRTLNEKEQRVADRARAAEQDVTAQREREFQAQFAQDQERAGRLIGAQEARVAELTDVYVTARERRDAETAGTPEYDRANEAFIRVEAKLQENELLRNRMVRVINNDVPRSGRAALATVREQMAAKEARIAEREQAAARAEEEFQAALQRDRARAEPLIQKQRAEVDRLAARYNELTDQISVAVRENSASVRSLEEARSQAIQDHNRASLALNRMNRLRENLTRRNDDVVQSARQMMNAKEERIAVRRAEAEARERAEQQRFETALRENKDRAREIANEFGIAHSRKEGEYERARQEYERVLSGNSPPESEITQASNALEEADRARRSAKKTYDRVRRLAEGRFTRQEIEDLDDTIATVAMKELRVAERLQEDATPMLAPARNLIQRLETRVQTKQQAAQANPDNLGKSAAAIDAERALRAARENKEAIRQAANREVTTARGRGTARAAINQVRFEEEQEAQRQETERLAQLERLAAARRAKQEEKERAAAQARADAERQAAATVAQTPETPAPARPAYATREGRGRRSNLRVRL